MSKKSYKVPARGKGKTFKAKVFDILKNFEGKPNNEVTKKLMIQALEKKLMKNNAMD